MIIIQVTNKVTKVLLQEELLLHTNTAPTSKSSKK